MEKEDWTEKESEKPSNENLIKGGTDENQSCYIGSRDCRIGDSCNLKKEEAMARGVNKVILLGHVGQDPEMKYTSGGVAMVQFPIATNESWKDTEGKLVEKTTWHNCTAWRKLAEIVAEYVKKGSKIYVEGKIDNSTYEKDGIKHYSSKVIIDQMLMLDGKSQVDSSSQPEPELEQPRQSETQAKVKAKPSKQESERKAPVDDLPF